MNAATSRPWARTVASLLALLVGCGGGGGGDDGSSASPVAVTISSQPASQSVTAPATATFAVSATGTPTPTFQWQVSTDGGATFANIGTATSAIYTTPPTTVADDGKRFRVMVSNGAGSVASAAAMLTVSPTPAAPAITVHPASRSVFVSVTATFTVTATGTPTPTYQWQVSTDGGATFANISAATSAIYTTPPAAGTDDSKRFRVVVSNSAGSVASVAAILTVWPLGITINPASQSVVAPATATFSVTVAGTSTPTFQWQVSADGGATFSDLSGATVPTYTTPSTALSDNGKQFRVRVSNDAGTITSNSALLTVASGPGAPQVSSHPLPTGVIAPQVATFSVSATATLAPSYQWQQSGNGGTSYTDIAGATASTYTTAPTTLADNGKKFRVRVYNTSGEVLSLGAPLGVSAAFEPILTGVRNVYTFITTCATTDPAYATIRNDFEILNDSVPFAGHITCREPYTTNPIEQMSEELLTVQTLQFAYYMSIGTEGKLPWTSLGLYGWMKSQIAGVNIVEAQGNSSCCAILNGKKYITVSRKSAALLTNFYREWKAVAAWLALLSHEARHAAGYGHVSGCPTFPLPTDPSGCDPTYDESNLGAYGIQRWLFSRWATGELNVGIACGAPVDASRDAIGLAASANGYRGRFVSNAPTDIIAPTPYGGICRPQ